MDFQKFLEVQVRSPSPAKIGKSMKSKSGSRSPSPKPCLELIQLIGTTEYVNNLTRIDQFRVNVIFLN